MTLNYSCSRFASVADVIDKGCNCTLDATQDQLLIETVLDEASDMLAILSGLRVHGVCTRTVRPFGNESCLPESVWSLSGAPGPWYLQGSVPLRGPRTDVVEVMIDGVVLPPSEYRLVQDRYLTRVGAAWPTSNSVTGNDTDVGVWSITYRFGYPPDFLTKAAAVELTCEMLDFYGTGSSNLPDGVVAANIQGAQVSLQGRAEALAEGADELVPAISRFLGIYAPDGQARSTIWSPELNLGVDLVEVEGPSGS